MKKILFQFSILFTSLFLYIGFLGAHCEIPCGIYDDEMRVKMIFEHISTIEKSIKQIMKLEKDADRNYNQLIRWVVNKEQHANELQEIVTQYFMTQRIKLGAKDYEKKLTPQARPNVIFEAGMAMGRFPKRTILIKLGELRPFSDIEGRHTVLLDNSVEKRKNLAQRLENAGCQISLSGTEWHTAGDFESAIPK